MNIVIFANGEPPPVQHLKEYVKQADLVIAADGGANHCHEYGQLADILVGDLDSIEPSLLTEYQHQQKEIHQYPANKNATDLELCMDLAVERGAKNISIFGAVGGRWDMSFGNILLGASSRYRSVNIQFFNRGCRMQILQPASPHRILGRIGATLSILPLAGEATGVQLKGVEYPLSNHRIGFGSSLGLSNVFSEPEVTVQLTTGILLAVIED